MRAEGVTCTVLVWLMESLAKPARTRFTETWTSMLPPAGTMPLFGKTESHGGITHCTSAAPSWPEGCAQPRKRKQPSPWPLFEMETVAASPWMLSLVLGSRMCGACGVSAPGC